MHNNFVRYFTLITLFSIGFLSINCCTRLVIRHFYNYVSKFEVLENDTTILHGRYELYKDGLIDTKGQYSNGKKVGEWIYFFNQDTLQKITYSEHKRVECNYDRFGKLYSTLEFFEVSKKFNITRFKEGKLLVESYNSDSSLSNIHYYYPSGKLYEKIKFIDGDLFSHETFYESGLVKIRVTKTSEESKFLADEFSSSNQLKVKGLIINRGRRFYQKGKWKYFGDNGKIDSIKTRSEEYDFQESTKKVM